MENKAWTTAKVHLRTMRLSLFVVLNTMIAFVISSSIGVYVGSGDAIRGGEISPANAFWLLPIIVGAGIPGYSFRRIINLGGKRDSFFWGTLLTYIMVAAGVSFIVTASNFIVELFIENHFSYDPAFFGGIANLVEVFGWAERGAVVTFFQQFAFLLLLTIFIHTLTSIQGRWYGWVTNVTLVAILAIFIPIAPLRGILVWFFTLILFHPNFLVQIFACLILAAGLYALSKPIFARKVI